jgi:serine/threonine protein kinase
MGALFMSNLMIDLKRRVSITVDLTLTAFCIFVSAPEIVSGEEYGLKIDMWSLGVISYILLGGYPPFSEQEGRPSLDQQITLGLVTFDEDSWADISSKAKDFISKLLIVDTEKRMSAEQALNHPIFKVRLTCKQKTTPRASLGFLNVMRLIFLSRCALISFLSYICRNQALASLP